MFDIGFAELLLIAVVGLLVIGPERLPGAIRTGSAWLNRLRRGFNELKHEVQRELHNDAVMEELRKTSESVRKETERWRDDLTGSGDGRAPEDIAETERAQAPAEPFADPGAESTATAPAEASPGPPTPTDAAARDDGDRR
ncbi:Sec-independent protein translocase protein TatB [Pseudohaliea rubra]|uniref:Sec-independent protein translocase protein TatB n=1 Tax=Pseudohaliea rubra DSM 19751 TaxID=1265313 RepID=A0A095VNW5_9GAMM|nr:Sec-independent protein translocase protein TatB [Pseudohaliea rubra]KGE03132.1 Twin-arginine translocation protein TatB [Pseudohaliea rubra DSM 19751]